MSQSEIDALAARQLCRQSKRYYSPPSRTLLACDVFAACLLEWLGMGPAALSVYLPRALAEADRRAVDLTGDVEAFVSAIAGLARFSGAHLPEASLRETAARSGIPADRVRALAAERIAPAEDRYPTTGSYIATGPP